MSDRAETSAPAAPAKGGLQADIMSGFLVFLIALPLCLAIAGANKSPYPIVGVWTAVLGGVICTFIGNSALTIKGPAAGLIVIVAGAVTAFQADLVEGGMAKEAAGIRAYEVAMGIGLVAAFIQIVFGLARAGVLADLFPISAVHGLLASIGVIIILKQAYLVIGQSAPDGEAIESLFEFPAVATHTVATVAAIGIPSLMIMFAWTYMKHSLLKKVPGQVIVLLFAIAMGYILDIDKKFLVPIASPVEDIDRAFLFPKFDGIATVIGIKYIVLFSLIGSLESLLAAKAIDLLDPLKRKTDLNRDLLGVGVANTVAACIGGSPMISEIVRSKANIDNGARSRFSNLFHGLFLLLAVVFLAGVLARIPRAALGAMLVFTGYRLAHPREFMRTLKIGFEQLLIFVTTIVVVLFTDLLIGIAAGMAVKLLTLLYWRIWPAQWFRLDSSTEIRADGAAVIHITGPIVFLNWIRLDARIAALDARRIIVNVAKTTFIDHTSIDKFHDLRNEFQNAGRFLEAEGLESMKPVSSHNLSARKSGTFKARKG